MLEKMESLMPLNFKTAEERDKWIKDHAQYFSVIYFHGRGKYERSEHYSLVEAEEAAKRIKPDDQGRRPMIYAVAGGHDAFVKNA